MFQLGKNMNIILLHISSASSLHDKANIPVIEELILRNATISKLVDWILTSIALGYFTGIQKLSQQKKKEEKKPGITWVCGITQIANVNVVQISKCVAPVSYTHLTLPTKLIV